MPTLLFMFAYRFFGLTETSSLEKTRRESFPDATSFKTLAPACILHRTKRFAKHHADREVVIVLTLFHDIPSIFSPSCRVSDEMYKLCSINLSPNVTGQVALGIMCNPPRPGSESYTNNMREKDVLLQSLIRRARSITDAFNR